MSRLDLPLLGEKVAVVERHLARVALRLPSDETRFLPASDESDAVILHLWQAVQCAIDLALVACVHFKLGAPKNYAEAFRALAAHGVVDPQLAERLARAAGFRNVMAHAYEALDMTRVYRTAVTGPADLRAFLAALRDALKSAV